MTRESIDSLASRLAASLPAGLAALKDDVEANFRAVLRQGLERMDLVTREEFEVQELVLARTRQKLEALEVRLAALESGPGAAAAPGADRPAKKPAAKKKTQRKAAKKKNR